MKSILLFIAVIFCWVNTAYGQETSYHISLYAESMENGSATGAGIMAGSDVFYGGLNWSYIESSRVIQRDNRKNIRPFYLFMGLRVPIKFSPYIEAGIDLPEAFIDDLLNNEEKSEVQADYYFSGGLMFKMNKKVSLSLYAKKYNFIFRENIYAPTVKTRPHSYGAGVAILF